MKQHSQNLYWLVRPDRIRSGDAPCLVPSDDRNAARANLEQTGSPHSATLHSRSEATPIVTEADYPSALWWSVFAFFMEGFAAYGVSQYPAPASVEWTLTAAKTLKPRSSASGLTATECGHHIDPQFENGNVVELGRVEALGAGRPGSWNWLTSLSRAVVILWMHWRREREIRKAVAALAELDDRTLRDLGICDRSQIDQAVRYCRDC